MCPVSLFIQANVPSPPLKEMTTGLCALQKKQIVETFQRNLPEIISHSLSLPYYLPLKNKVLLFRYCFCIYFLDTSFQGYGICPRNMLQGFGFQTKSPKAFFFGGGGWKIFIGGTSRQFWKTYLELTPDSGLYLTPSSLPPMGKDGKQTTKTLCLSAYMFLRKLIQILQFTLNVSYKSLLENNLPTKWN